LVPSTDKMLICIDDVHLQNEFEICEFYRITLYLGR